MRSFISSPRIIRVIKSRKRRWGYVERIVETRKAYAIFVERVEGKGQRGRPRRR